MSRQTLSDLLDEALHQIWHATQDPINFNRDTAWKAYLDIKRRAAEALYPKRSEENMSFVFNHRVRRPIATIGDENWSHLIEEDDAGHRRLFCKTNSRPAGMDQTAALVNIGALNAARSLGATFARLGNSRNRYWDIGLDEVEKCEVPEGKNFHIVPEPRVTLPAVMTQFKARRLESLMDIGFSSNNPNRTSLAEWAKANAGKGFAFFDGEFFELTK